MLQKLLIAAFCLLAAITANAQNHCKGVTTKHQPCKQTFIDSLGYCRFHSPNRILCAHKNCHNVVKQINTYCRFHQPHAVRIIRETTDECGLTSVQFIQEHSVYALDYPTKAEYNLFIENGYL